MGEAEESPQSRDTRFNRRRALEMGVAAAGGVLAGEVGRRIISQEPQITSGDVHLEETDEKTGFRGRVDISSPLLRKDTAVRRAFSSLMEGHLIVAEVILAQDDSEAAQKIIAIMARKNREGIREIMGSSLSSSKPAVAKKLATTFTESAETAQV